MSSIVISGDTSGSITLSAPAVSGSSVLTLPAVTDTVAGIAATQTLTNKSIVATQLTGTIAAARLPAGSVLQVVSGSTNVFVSSSTTTFVDTGLTASITPTSATSKVLVLVSQTGCQKSSASSSNALDLRLLRGASAVSDIAGALVGTGSAIENIASASTCFLDSPATTSSVTYKTDFSSRNNTASVSVQFASSRSTITLMEIAA